MAQQSARIVKSGMRLVITDGRHLGWATRLAQPGDEVFLLLGCSVPGILRKHNDESYKLVRGSILHDYMQEQGIGDDEDTGKWPTLTVFLKRLYAVREHLMTRP